MPYTIRFKLTLLYSIILFLFSFIIVLSINLYLNSYLKTDPIYINHQSNLIKFEDPNDPKLKDPNFQFKKLQFEERERIRKIRLNDLKQFQKISLISLIPIAFLSFIIGYFISGKFLKPIKTLKDEINQIKTHNLGKTIQVKQRDEVGELIESFNDLSLRLKTSFDNQQQFVQDASHELRTPLTIIQTNLDTILDDPNGNKKDLINSIKNALNAVKNLKKLTDYLLDLTINRSLVNENSNLPELLNSENSNTFNENFQFKEVNLNQIIKNQINSLQKYADKKQINIKTDLPKENIIIKADEISFSQALFNIIENAIKYCPKESNVSVILQKKDKTIFIIIHDDGIGILPQYQDKIFERFYRIDKSRNKKNGGFGLGLAISKKVIENHNGKIILKSQPKDTSFIIEIPEINEKLSHF